MRLPDARALWLVAPGAAEIRPEPLPSPGPTQVLVRTLYSAISRGTESLVFLARVPESEYERMRCPHQAGAFPFPVKYGYMNVGQVVAGPAALLDRLVFCLFPHQSAYVVEAASVVPLPAGLPAERAVLAANLETAINALWDAQLLVGDRVSVVGGGVVGCLCAHLARSVAGVHVELIDSNPNRAHVAHSLGLDFATPEAAERERDVVFHASGTEAGLHTALDLCAHEAKIVELSWFGKTSVALPLGGAFHVKRLTLRSSQVGKVSPSARARWNHRSRLELALRLCSEPALVALIDGESDFEALPAALPALLSSSGGLCQRVRYR